MEVFVLPLNKDGGEFPGGPVFRTLPSNEGGEGLINWSGNTCL